MRVGRRGCVVHFGCNAAENRRRILVLPPKFAFRRPQPRASALAATVCSLLVVLGLPGAAAAEVGLGQIAGHGGCIWQQDSEESDSDLLKAMADTEARVRSLCADTLGKLPPTKAIRDRLSEALADKDEDVRLSAARGLWDGAEAAERGKLVQALAAALESENLLVRKRVAQMLGEFGPAARAAVPALLLSLRDRESAVRDAAAAALKQIDPKAAAKAGVR